MSLVGSSRAVSRRWNAFCWRCPGLAAEGRADDETDGSSRRSASADDDGLSEHGCADAGRRAVSGVGGAVFVRGRGPADPARLGRLCRQRYACAGASCDRKRRSRVHAGTDRTRYLSHRAARPRAPDYRIRPAAQQFRSGILPVRYLVIQESRRHIETMLKRRAKTAGTPKSAPGKHEVIATLPDGVRILAPVSKPKHFTSKEIRSTIQELRRNSTIGSSAAAAKRG
jgi:hypothetical protein